MITIEIHVETIEETEPSTRPTREAGRPNRAIPIVPNPGNRFWKAFNFSTAGSLAPQNKTEDER